MYISVHSVSTLNVFCLLQKHFSFGSIKLLPHVLFFRCSLVFTKFIMYKGEELYLHDEM